MAGIRALQDALARSPAADRDGIHGGRADTPPIPRKPHSRLHDL